MCCPLTELNSLGLGGAHVQVRLPKAAGKMAPGLVRLGDRAMMAYAEILGIALPKTAFPVFFCAVEEQEQEQRACIEKRFPLRQPGFTKAGDGSWIRLIPSLHPAESAVPGDLEATLLHELAHALEYRTVPGYRQHPSWLKEGLADLLSAIVLGGDLSRIPSLSDKVRLFQDAIAARDQIGLSELLHEAGKKESQARALLRVSEAFSLCWFLYSSDQVRFRTFIAHLIRQRANSVGVESLVTEIFGPLRSLEERWMEAAKAVAVEPWERLLVDLRMLPDGGLLIQTYGDTWGGMLHSKSALAPGRRLGAKLRFEKGGAREADVLLAVCEERLFGVRFERSGFTDLWALEDNGGRRSLSSGLGRTRIGDLDHDHEVSVALSATGVIARVDGELALEAPLPWDPLESTCRHASLSIL